MSTATAESIISAAKQRLSSKEMSTVSALHPFVTISRTCGAGGNALAQRLKMQLDSQVEAGQAAWHVFDRQLATSFTEDPDLKKNIDGLFSEHYNNQVQEFVAELFAKKRPQDLALFELSKLSRKVAYAGKTIFVGLGSCMSTRALRGGLHIHLVAPEAVRIERIEKLNRMSHSEATKFVRHSDTSYARMMKDHFHADINDATLFDVVFNTTAVELDQICDLVVQLVQRR